MAHQEGELPMFGWFRRKRTIDLDQDPSLGRSSYWELLLSEIPVGRTIWVCLSEGKSWSGSYGRDEIGRHFITDDKSYRLYFLPEDVLVISVSPMGELLDEARQENERKPRKGSN